MLPAMTVNQFVYAGKGYAIFFGNVFPRRPVSHQQANLDDLFFGQFCRPMFFSFACRAVLGSVGLIFAWRSPSKIVQAVVNWISVKVSALSSLGAWANKSQQNQVMYISHPWTNKNRSISASTTHGFHFPGKSICASAASSPCFFGGKDAPVWRRIVSCVSRDLLYTGNATKLNHSHYVSPCQNVVVREPAGLYSRAGFRHSRAFCPYCQPFQKEG